MQFNRRLPLSLSLIALLGLGAALGARDIDSDPFRQIDELLPSPNNVRTASGAPGAEYWQQRVDYLIDVELDDQEQHIRGSETVTYTNNSPDTLPYLWMQLDPNIFGPASHAALKATAPSLDGPSYRSIRNMLHRQEFDGSMDITSVRTTAGDAIDHTIVDTMMRIDLPKALESGESTSFQVDWNYGR